MDWTTILVALISAALPALLAARYAALTRREQAVAETVESMRVIREAQEVTLSEAMSVSREQNEQLATQVLELRAELDRLADELAAVKVERARLQGQVISQSGRIDRLEAQLRSAGLTPANGHGIV